MWHSAPEVYKDMCQEDEAAGGKGTHYFPGKVSLASPAAKFPSRSWQLRGFMSLGVQVLVKEGSSLDRLLYLAHGVLNFIWVLNL